MIARLIGPKMLGGALLAAISALGFVTWQWQSAEESASTATERVIGLSADLQHSESVVADQRADLAALDAAIEARREREREARARAAQAEQALAALEDSDEQVKDWSDTRVPDGVRRWLREPADSD